MCVCVCVCVCECVCVCVCVCSTFVVVQGLLSCLISVIKRATVRKINFAAAKYKKVMFSSPYSRVLKIQAYKKAQIWGLNTDD